MSQPERIGSAGQVDLSIDLVKRHIRIDHNADDDLIALYLAAAVDHVENHTRRSLAVAKYRQTYACFGAAIDLLGPTRQITSVRYYAPATSGTTAARQPWVPLKGQRAVLNGERGRLDMAGVIVPALAQRPDALEIEFFAGYGIHGGGVGYGSPGIAFYGASPARNQPLPADIKQALLLLVGHFYENREASIVGTGAQELNLGVKRLLRPYENPRA